MFKIALDAGHGLKTSGKQTPDGIKEWTLNDKVRDKVAKFLADYDVKLIYVDGNEGKTDETLAQRLKVYLDAEVDAFVSIHHNAFQGVWGNATGVEVFTDRNFTARDQQLAEAIYNKLVKYTGLKGRGIKRENWYVINQNKVPAVLVEGGFMDGKNDYKVITSDAGQTAYAKAVAEGLIEFLGLKKKKSISTTSTKVKVETPKVETSTPIKTPIVASNIKEGDIVKVNEGAKDYNGKKIASFVYKSTYKVDELKGDRAVLDKNGICTAFKVKDLTTVKSTKVKVETPKPIAKPATPTLNYFPKYNGKSSSLVDALKYLGINSALSYRGKIAQANGVIKNSALYIGLKSHNEKMFALLKQGKLIKP